MRPRKPTSWQLWKTYYGSIFNPARIKLNAMRNEMPVRHWPTLPETEIIPQLLADAPRRVAEMLKFQEGSSTSATDFLPREFTWESLRDAAFNCRGCDLYRSCTQTVFGTGPTSARVMLVGEQPGDQEDLTGEPFVGPAGRVLDEVLAVIGLPRDEIYLTNAVKHFKHQVQGKRRLHQRPGVRETTACKPWLVAELQLVQPQVLICLGAVAAQQVFGRAFQLNKQAGRVRASEYCEQTLATFHPAAILRHPSPEKQTELRTRLEEHLRLALSLAEN